MKQAVKQRDISDKGVIIGHVIYAFGPLVHVLVNGKVKKGAIAYVVLSDGVKLMSEVIEINGTTVKIQVFEDTRGISVGLSVMFLDRLLSAVLAPGLLGHVFDGLQNPLADLAKISGAKLERGLYIDPVSPSKLWEYTPLLKDGDVCYAGDRLGFVIENDLKHYIMAPLDLDGPWCISNTHPASSVCVEDIIATLISSNPDEEARLVSLLLWHPIKTPFIHGTKIASFEPLITGLRVLDMQIPLMKGGAFASPGPFGAGKTMLQYHLARFSNVDVVVLVACGERAGEVVQFISEFKDIKDLRTGKPLMDRTIIICNTSSMPVAAREASLYLGVTIGEYYRQMGYHVLVLADSTSRWAQAMREISGKLEEIPGEEAYPPYLASAIAAFYERAGVLDTGISLPGSLTIGGAVSPAGGNFEEPVTQATLASVGAFIGLSKSRADARKFPAIDPLISWSNNVKKTAAYWKEKSDGFMSAWHTTKQLLSKGDDIARLIEVLGEDGVSLHDLTKFLQAEIYDFVFLQQNAFDEDDRYSSSEKSHVLLGVILTVCSVSVFGHSPDEARDIASKVKFLMKNLCYMDVESLEFQISVAEVYKLINTNTNYIEVV